MSAADTRGFHYPLQAVMLRREWAVERTQSELAQARAHCAGLEQAREKALQACEAQAGLAATAWTAAPDPAARRQMLGYLARLREQASDLLRRIETARLEVQELERTLEREQVRLATLQEHRDGLRGEYAVGQQRAAEAQADAQWLILSEWRRRAGP